MAARKRTYMEVHEALDVDRTAEGVAPATRGKWLYDDTLGAWVLSYNTLPYVPVEHINGSTYVPRPESPTNSNTANRSAVSTYSGATFLLERPVRFNRLSVLVNTSTPPYTGRIALYQAAAGGVASTVQLRASFVLSDLAAGRHELTPAQGTVQLVRGVYWLLYGVESGDFSLRLFNTAAVDLFNTSMVAGDHPTVFVTTVSAVGAPPATVNPLEGGADGFAGNANSWAAVHRFRTV